MHFVERGHGAPLVFITGLQGRWEYSAVAIEALAKRFRVVTFPLADEPAAAYDFDSARPAESYVEHIEAVMDAAGIKQGAICGLSFGGVLALHFAAVRPARVRALILASTPGPGFHLRRKHEIYTRVPWLFGPIFFAETPRRLRREVAIALPARADRIRLAWLAVKTLMTTPLSPSRMAARARLIATINMESDCAAVTAPTLVITGEPGLDHVVRVDQSSDFTRHIAGAASAIVARTGHLGSLTRPEIFAEAIHGFVKGTPERENAGLEREALAERPTGRGQDVA